MEKVFWKKECDYCCNRTTCCFESATRTLVQQLCAIELRKDISGKVVYRCNHFYLDDEVE